MVFVPKEAETLPCEWSVLKSVLSDQWKDVLLIFIFSSERYNLIVFIHFNVGTRNPFWHEYVIYQMTWCLDRMRQYMKVRIVK